MPSVKRNLFAIAVAIVLLIPAFAPNVSFAAGCECFCGNEGDGALDSGIQASSETCSAACTAVTWKMVGCYADESDYPVHSAKCWRKSECEGWSETSYGKTIKASWGTRMPYDCSPTKTNPEEMRYCYADDTPITLNIPIGGVSEVQSFASYIGIIYDWLLPAGALIAVVMMMVGGLQYILSRGKEKYISKGKERITNAITGIVLLLSVFVLLNLIDPRLTILNSLKVPLIKTLTILNTGDSCENLNDVANIVTSPKTGTCGTKGKVSDISGVSDQVVSSWKKDDPCDFTTCPNMGESCASATDGTKSCVTCGNNPLPSESNCSALSVPDFSKAGDGWGKYQIDCSYDATENSCLAVVMSAGSKDGSYDCGTLQNQAAAQNKYNGCEFYETLFIAGKTGVGGPIVSEGGAVILERICTADPCHLHEEGLDGLTASGCHYTRSSVATDSGSADSYRCEGTVFKMVP